MRHFATKIRTLSNNSVRSSLRKLSTNKKAHTTTGKESVGKSQTNPKIADKAAETKAARSASGNSSTGFTILGVGVIGGVGYAAYKIKTDPSFATSLGFATPSEVAIEEKKSNVKKTAEKPIQQEEAPAAAADDTDSVAADISSAAAAPSLVEEETEKEGEKKEEKEDTEESQQTPEEARKEAQETAISAVVASEKMQAQAGETVQTTLDEAHEDATAVADLKPTLSEKQRLREEVRDLEKSVAEQQTEVRRNTVAQLRVSEAKLRGELEDVLARDLSTSNIEELRRRVVQLVMELQERNKTEAAQLIAVLESAEQKASEKSVQALREQSEKYDDLVRVSLREQEVKLQDDYAQRLDDYITESTLRIQQVSSELNTAHKEDLETKLALSRAEQDAEIAAVSSEENAASYARANATQATRIAAVEDLRLKLQALDKVFQVNAEYLSNSHQIHLVCTALLALHSSLNANGGDSQEHNRRTSLSEATASLKVAADFDPVIIAALNSLPKAAMAGVPTLSELELRFAIARAESRKALYTPEEGGVVGHALGSVAAGLLMAPTHDSHNGAEGEGTEACLARAHHYISSGNVRLALHEVGRIEGDAAAVMVDWVESARTRLLVEQAVTMIGAHVTTLVATLS